MFWINQLNSQSVLLRWIKLYREKKDRARLELRRSRFVTIMSQERINYEWDPQRYGPQKVKLQRTKCLGRKKNSASASCITFRFAQTGLYFYFTFYPHLQCALFSSILFVYSFPFHSFHSPLFSPISASLSCFSFQVLTDVEVSVRHENCDTLGWSVKENEAVLLTQLLPRGDRLLNQLQ